MRKIRKLSQTKPKVKRKKMVEMPSQIRPRSTKTSNVASTSKTQNMGERASQAREGEYVRVRVGLSPLEAQQREALRVCEVRHTLCSEVVSGDKMSKQREEEANQECGQGVEEAASESGDSEVESTQQRHQGQAMTESSQVSVARSLFRDRQ